MSKSVKESPKAGVTTESGEKVPQRKVSKGKTTTEIMHKHLQDINDVISDDDFKNLKLDLDTPSGTAHTPEIADDNDRPKDEDKDHAIITPWDVIS